MGNIKEFYDVNKLIETAKSYVDKVKAEDLAKELKDIYTKTGRRDNISLILNVLDELQKGEKPFNIANAEEIMSSTDETNPTYDYELVKLIAFKYGKDGHELLLTSKQEGLTATEKWKANARDVMSNQVELPPEKQWEYNLKKEENEALEGKLPDELAIEKVMHVLAETNASLNFEDVLKFIPKTIALENLKITDYQKPFDIVEKDGNFYLAMNGKIVTDKIDPKRINTHEFMKVAENTMKEKLASKEDLSTDKLTDEQARKMLQSHIYIAVKYQGWIREIGERELVPENDIEVKDITTKNIGTENIEDAVFSDKPLEFLENENHDKSPKKDDIGKDDEGR